MNPYLPQQSQAITNQVNQNLQQVQLPGINSQAIAAGGFGGSRQGVAQGLAIGQTNQALGNSLANLNFNAWNQGEQNRMQQQSLDNNYALGNKQADNSYNLGLGNLGLGQMQANQNFYSTQRGQDLQQAGLGANLVSQGNLGLGQGAPGLYQAGQYQQQAPLQALQGYAGVLSPFTGLNSSTQSTQPGASTLGSALGGALTAAQLWALMSKGNS